MADPIPEGSPLNWCGQRGDHRRRDLIWTLQVKWNLEHFRKWKGDTFREMTPMLHIKSGIGLGIVEIPLLEIGDFGLYLFRWDGDSKRF